MLNFIILIARGAAFITCCTVAVLAALAYFDVLVQS
jgi:hypothetical protein